MLVEHDAGVGVEYGGSLLVEEVSGDDSVFGVAEDARELVLGSFLHSSRDILGGSSLFETAGEVNHGDVSGGNAQ